MFSSSNLCDHIAESLKDLGVGQVFGIPGDAINGLIEALRKQDELQFVSVRHEAAGAFAASAQGKFGQLGVCVGTAGPGATNLLTGLYDAKLDGASVLAITGQVPTRYIGTGFHQEIDDTALFRDVAAYSQRVSRPEQLPELLHQACQIALSEGAVAHLSLPTDVAMAELPEPPKPLSVAPEARIRPCQEDLDAAIRLIEESRRVTILAGRGAKPAVDSLVDIAGRLGAPIIKTLPAKDLLPDAHPLCVGGLGLLGSSAAMQAVEDCDLLLMIGTDFPYPDFYPEQARCIQVELDPRKIGRRYPIDVALLGHSQLTLPALADALAPRAGEAREHLEAVQEAMRSWRSEQQVQEQAEVLPIRPERLAAEIGRAAPNGTIFTCDTGAVTVWAARNLALREDQRFTLSANLGSMGYALPAAIGLQLAHPDRPVVALAGDGGFSMYMGELLTAVEAGLPITTVVFNNAKLGLIQMEQEAEGLPESDTALHNPNFAAFARNCGAEAWRIEEPAELGDRLHQAIRSERPVLLDVDVDPEALTLPPRIEPDQVFGFAKAKLREMLGQGDADAGLSPIEAPIRDALRRRLAQLGED